MNTSTQKKPPSSCGFEVANQYDLISYLLQINSLEIK